MSLSGNAIRRIVLEQSKRAGVGHIGSALSVADILSALYRRVLRGVGTNENDRDRFILSKGHAALAQYAALRLRGTIGDQELETFCGDRSVLGVHPEHVAPGIDFSTGSLGHGLSIGVGAALAARMQGSQRRVFVLLSDAEMNEGSVWEAAMFAAHHELSNLTALIDLNGQQALGYTKDVLDLSPLEERWRAFGWDVTTVDGHDEAAIAAALSGAGEQVSSPKALICRTTFGKGVAFMEGQIKWHYLPMSSEQYQKAISGLETGP